ncbi:57bfd9b1-6c08-4389-86db-5ba566c2ee6d [Thermothielavioides terrestris]|uniref:57bfd9b1-6c08-4389-86db-5ba566c2ee6d n=1 Tax=Thermothielavioides terrestris TaxID=2587410 RepID=A0A3S4AZT4_9PEZI|nr:57bfd9b1-6c08-4389-86db-5ba566c2ee6d [Thermothielavioides terrestris]
MEAKARAKGRQQLIESLINAGSNAFNPDVSEDMRAPALREFDGLVQRTKTLDLLAALSILIRPGRVPPWLRSKLMETLTRVPLRPNGVRATLEFVFSVHPSSTVKVSEAATPQTRGANITQEALNLASNLLSTQPASATPETWYSTISPQLLLLLDGGEGPEVAKVAAYVIGRILGRKSSGAPDTAGWKYLAEPMLNPIKPPELPSDVGTELNGIIDLSKPRVIVQPEDIATALRRLHSLAEAHPNPDLCRRLLSRLITQLWALASWPDPPPPMAESVLAPARELFKIFLKLTPTAHFVLFVIANLDYVGGFTKRNPEWRYETTPDGQVQIVDSRQLFKDADAEISTAFLELLKRWLRSTRDLKGGETVIKKAAEEQDPVTNLAELRTLQAMMERFPDKLATQPKAILDLVSQILAGSAGNADEDDEVSSVALSLLNIIITAPGFQKSRVDPAVLSLIESSLDKLSRGATNLSQTASNLRLLLLYRDELEEPASATNTTAAPTNRQVEDRKTYNLAVSYILDQDSPAPVRSEGLHLLGTLITSRSPVLDIPGILALLATVIPNADEYVYLHAIRLYALLCPAHPRAVLRELADRFADAREAHPLDARLRFGEALLQVVQRLGGEADGLSGGRGGGLLGGVDGALREVANALVAVAGRRGRRPKTEARRRREAEAKRRKDREAAEAWGGEVPDLGLDEETGDEDEGERARNEALERIVAGWEGTRGSEDVRVRASALSVLGAVVEAGVAALGRELVVAAVDLCVAVLQMEREPEKGILRRAAVLFVLSFVRALEKARQRGTDPGVGFGGQAQEDVLRTLRYVAETDNDGLVVQHSRDVVESLENWQIVRLLPPERSQQQDVLGGGLTKLAGLEVDPDSAAAVQSGSKPRPMIEEVE